MTPQVSPRANGAFVGGLGGAGLIGAANNLLEPYPSFRSLLVYSSPLLAIWATVAYAAFIVWLKDRAERRDVKQRVERFRAFVDDVERAGKGSPDHVAGLRRELEELERLYAGLERSGAYALSRAFASLDQQTKVSPQIPALAGTNPTTAIPKGRNRPPASAVGENGG
jgi:hypothetical protein